MSDIAASGAIAKARPPTYAEARHLRILRVLAVLLVIAAIAGCAWLLVQGSVPVAIAALYFSPIAVLVLLVSIESVFLPPRP